jgi:hypothetical protein
MNTKLKLIGAALVALAILPAAVLLFHVNPLQPLMGLVTVAGVVTVTYQSFQAQGELRGCLHRRNCGAHQAQAVQVQAVVALVAMADTDTTATITHNMNISTAGLAAQQPYISHYISTPGNSTSAAVLCADRCEHRDGQQNQPDGFRRHVHGHHPAALLGQPIGGDLWPWLSRK